MYATSRARRAGDTRGAILEYMRSYQADEGVLPTIREIGSALGGMSAGNVHYHIRKLLEAGQLRQGGGNRRYRLVGV